MTERMIGLSEKLVNLKGFRWKAGMADIAGWRLLRPSTQKDFWIAYSSIEGHLSSFCKPTSPDLADPATIGCLASLAREMAEDPFLIFPFSIQEIEAEAIMKWLE